MSVESARWGTDLGTADADHMMQVDMSDAHSMAGTQEWAIEDTWGRVAEAVP